MNSDPDSCQVWFISIFYCVSVLTTELSACVQFSRQHLCEWMSSWYIHHKAGCWRNRARILLALWPRLFDLYRSIAQRLPHLCSRIPASPSTLCHTLSNRVQISPVTSIYFVLHNMTSVIKWLSSPPFTTDVHVENNRASVFHVFVISSVEEQLLLALA